MCISVSDYKHNLNGQHVAYLITLYIWHVRRKEDTLQLFSKTSLTNHLIVDFPRHHWNGESIYEALFRIYLFAYFVDAVVEVHYLLHSMTNYCCSCGRFCISFQLVISFVKANQFLVKNFKKCNSLYFLHFDLVTALFHCLVYLIY